MCSRSQHGGYPRPVLARLVLAGVVMAAAMLIASRLNQRPRSLGDVVRVSDRANVPAQLDRADFTRPDALWLLVLFSSAHCAGCAEMSSKVSVLETSEVAVCEIDYAVQPALQERYGVDAVPLVVIADAEGVVRDHVFGNVPASEIWSVVARARGSGHESPG